MKLENMNLNDNHNNSVLVEKQNNFLQTSLGKVINIGLDIGLRAVLPDIIENKVIEIKDSMLESGLKDGIKTAINEGIDFGKSVTGMLTGNFENISQVQDVIKKGGVIDSLSTAIDYALEKCGQSKLIDNNTLTLIRQGKNVILNNINKNIEDKFASQLDDIEKIQKYSNNWENYYNKKDFIGMQREMEKIKPRLKDLIPLENTLKNVRRIENIHALIKNNNGNFDISKEEIELANKLV